MLKWNFCNFSSLHVTLQKIYISQPVELNEFFIKTSLVSHAGWTTYWYKLRFTSGKKNIHLSRRCCLLFSRHIGGHNKLILHMTCGIVCEQFQKSSEEQKQKLCPSCALLPLFGEHLTHSNQLSAFFPRSSWQPATSCSSPNSQQLFLLSKHLRKAIVCRRLQAFAPATTVNQIKVNLYTFFNLCAVLRTTFLAQNMGNCQRNNRIFN